MNIFYAPGHAASSIPPQPVPQPFLYTCPVWDSSRRRWCTTVVPVHWRWDGLRGRWVPAPRVLIPINDAFVTPSLPAFAMPPSLVDDQSANQSGGGGVNECR